jgi:hypothetical protein
MSKDTLIAKYEALPVPAQKQVETFIEFLWKTTPTKSARSTKRRFKFGWAGGLADLKKQFTVVELQHHIAVAQEHSLTIATQDKDFQRVRNMVDVRML